MRSFRRNLNAASHRNGNRRGMVLIVLIVIFAISMTLFGLWARSAVREHQRLALQAYRMQAVRLAESGIARAVARHAADSAYDGETWAVPAAELGGKHAAEVRIRITPIAESNQLRVEAVATYPDQTEPVRKLTRHRDISNPTSGNES